MRRNAKVCQGCPHYIKHKTAKPGPNRTMIPVTKHFCFVDDRGLERTGPTGMKWKEDPTEVTLEGFEALGLPDTCCMILEQTVMNGDKS